MKVFTVGIGTAEGELIPVEAGGFVKDRKGQVVKSRLDEDDAAEDRDRHGRRLPARGRRRRSGSTSSTATTSPRMEKRELASTLERRFEQRFQIPLALGAAAAR